MTLTTATLVMLVLRAPYTGSGRFGDMFDLDGLRAVLETKTGASLVSRLLLLGAAALFVAVLFGVYARRVQESPEDAGTSDGTDHGETERPEESGAPKGSSETSDLTFGLVIGGASCPVASQPPGPCPSTRRPVSSRASPCRRTSCT